MERIDLKIGQSLTNSLTFTDLKSDQKVLVDTCKVHIKEKEKKNLNFTYSSINPPIISLLGIHLP